MNDITCRAGPPPDCAVFVRSRAVTSARTTSGGFKIGFSGFIVRDDFQSAFQPAIRLQLVRPSGFKLVFGFAEDERYRISNITAMPI